MAILKGTNMEVQVTSPAADPGTPPVSAAPVVANIAPAQAAPSQAPTPVVSPAPTDGQTPPPTPGQTPSTEAELYELPDGRKVDAATLTQEWKNNFLPDYTKKSQTLAEMQKAMGVQPNNINNPQPQTPQAPAWTDPNWVPQTYAEIVEAAAQKMQFDQQQQQHQQEQYREQVNTFVDSQITEIKKIEPNLSEELLFQHANKYGFGDLMTAFKNMQDYNVALKRTEQQTVQNMQNRAADPIASKSGQGVSSSGVDYRSIQNGNFTAVDALRRLQGK